MFGRRKKPVDRLEEIMDTLRGRKRRSLLFHLMMLPIYLTVGSLGFIFGVLFFVLAAIVGSWRVILSVAVVGGLGYIAYCVMSHYGIDMTPWN